MDKSGQSADWLRWLDKRPLDAETQARLSGLVKDEGPESDRLLDDLDLHRQLSALGHLESEDSAFAERMADCFEATLDPPVTGESNDPRWIDAALSPPGQTESEFEIRVSTEKRPSSRRQGSRSQSRRRMVLVASIPPVIACLLIGWYVTSANRDDSRPETVDASRSGRAVDGDEKTNTPSPVDPKDALVDDRHRANPDNQRDQLAVIPENPFRPIPRRPLNPSTVAGETPDDERKPDSLTRFAMVRETQPCEWGSPVLVNERRGAGQLDLLSGEALVTFDHGSTLRIQGPAKFELVSPERIRCLSGNFTSHHPSHQERFVIESAAGEILPDSKSQFDLKVTPQGQTELLVRQGAIDVQPWHGQIRSDPISLSRRGLDRGIIQPSASNRPVLARFENNSGQFEGWVNVNGRLLKSANRPFVDDVLATAIRQWKKQPEQFETEWQNLVAMVNEDRPGAIRFGGQQFPMAAFEDLIRQTQGNKPGTDRDPGNPFQSSNRSFQGEIEINGTRIQFDTIEEFESARKKLLGSLSDSLEHFRK